MYKEFPNLRAEVNTVVALYAGGGACLPGAGYGPAVRREWLLHYVIAGKGTYTAGDQTYTVTKDQAFLIRPDEVTVYCADQQDPWSYVWIGLDTNVEAFHRLPYVLENKELTAVMRKYSDGDSLSHLNDLHMAALAWSVVACLCENAYDDCREGYVTRAAQIMERRYMEHITVQGIANELGIDRSYFSNLFKRQVGINPQQYLIGVRMKKALELLREERYTVSMVAVSVGYDDLFTFSRCFKNHYGVPPSAYEQIL